ncbi:MAG: hypothetical protein JKY04_09430 [Sneathiella sp.]|nr:hypothetical protein [Sneathiella sp.]
MELLKNIFQAIFKVSFIRQKVEDKESLLQDSVANAMLLILAASENAIKLDRDTVNHIIHAKNALKTGDLGTEDEQNFWISYENIASQMLPINIGSINATYDPDPNHRFSVFDFFTPRKKPLSRRCASNYKLLSLATLILLIAVQIFWYIGFTLTTDINRQTETINKLKNELEVATSNFQKPLISAENAMELVFGETHKIKIKIEEHIHWKEAAINHLESWNKRWSNFGFLTIGPWSDPEYSRLSQEVQRRMQFIAAGNMLQALSEYIFPILYGLIGACFYILRQLPKEIEALTFSMNSYISYSLRIAQGPLAGMVVSYFFTGEHENPAISTSSPSQIHSYEPGLNTLSPLAVAFLAGYSIEFIFRFIDKILNSSNPEIGTNKKNRGSQI